MHLLLLFPEIWDPDSRLSSSSLPKCPKCVYSETKINDSLEFVVFHPNIYIYISISYPTCLNFIFIGFSARRTLLKKIPSRTLLKTWIWVFFRVVTRAARLISTRVHLLCYACSPGSHLNIYTYKNFYRIHFIEISQTHTINFFKKNNFDDLENYLPLLFVEFL